MSKFRDLRTNLDVHPINGDILILDDENAISTQIKNLIFTDYYERPWDPTLGAGVPQTLFDNFGSDTEYMIESRIRNTINKYVDRAKLINVIIKFDGMNGYSATIIYQPINSLEHVTVDMFLTRTR